MDWWKVLRDRCNVGIDVVIERILRNDIDILSSTVALYAISHRIFDTLAIPTGLRNYILIESILVSSIYAQCSEIDESLIKQIRKSIENKKKVRVDEMYTMVGVEGESVQKCVEQIIELFELYNIEDPNELFKYAVCFVRIAGAFVIVISNVSEADPIVLLASILYGADRYLKEFDICF
ncbi:MAG: hypothetical protein QXJ45_06945 [Thermoproteota archaeon]